MPSNSSSNTPPPPYISVNVSDTEAAKIVATWDRQYPKDWRTKEDGNLTFTFRPEILQSPSLKRVFRNRQQQPAWQAYMSVRAKNVSHLMRSGFHWSPENVLKGQDGIVLNERNRPRWQKMGHFWKHTRIYHLHDSGSDPGWVALLYVFAKTPSTVIDFDLSQITKDTTIRVTAWNWNGHQAYNMEKGKKDVCFNAIFGDMALGGWWLALGTPRELKDGKGALKPEENRKRARFKAAIEMCINSFLKI